MESVRYRKTDKALPPPSIWEASIRDFAAHVKKVCEEEYTEKGLAEMSEKARGKQKAEAETI